MNSMNTTLSFKRLLMMLALVSTLAVAYGCGKKGDGGEAGEKIDEAVDEAQQGPKELLDNDGSAENTGEKVDEVLDNE